MVWRKGGKKRPAAAAAAVSRAAGCETVEPVTLVESWVAVAAKDGIWLTIYLSNSNLINYFI
jgi:hypothetical protein